MKTALPKISLNLSIGWHYENFFNQIQVFAMLMDEFG
jgi:hypothetical protein